MIRSSPYQEALDWINHHPSTEAAEGMVKLLLSLSDGSYAFSMRECMGSMDDPGLALALRVVAQYVRVGHADDRDLLDVAHILAERNPRLREIAEAWTQMRLGLIEQWRQEDTADPEGT